MFKKGELVFEYSFSLNDKIIIKEELIEIKKTTEHVIFTRDTLQDGSIDIKFPDFRFGNTEQKKENTIYC